MSNNLEPLDPRTAKQMYLDDRRGEVADATLQAHHYRLKQFVSWCDDEDIENLNSLSGRDLHRFRVKRQNDDDLATATMKGQLATLRMFVRFCTSIDAVEPKLDEKILLPTTTEDDARDEMLDSDRAWQILEHLEQYRYASLEHALFAVLWHTGIRIGAARGLNIEDYNAEDQYLELLHCPREDTPLKNKKQGERLVGLNNLVCKVLDDWLEVNHPGCVDEYGQKPLFSTNHGRISRNRGRSIAYQYSRPCVYDKTCPHNRDLEECDALTTSHAYECPSSLSPHPIRRGAITYHLQKGTPEPVVSDRMDVGMDVLGRHYDQRTKREKLQQRRQYLPGGQS
jgi:integrase